MLVCVARPDADGAITQSLAAVFAAGKAKRDRDGFNRFRFVVPTREPDVAREALTAAFRALPDTDDRQHLHVVDVSDVPRMG